MAQKKHTTKERFDKVAALLEPLKDHIPSVNAALKWLKRAEDAALRVEASNKNKGGPVEAARIKADRERTTTQSKARTALVKTLGQLTFPESSKDTIMTADNGNLILTSRADLALIADDPTAMVDAALTRGWVGLTDGGKPWSSGVQILYASPDLAKNTAKAIVAARTYARKNLGWKG